MRNLAVFIAVGWFWLLFYGVGPLNTATQFTVAAAALVGGCLVSALVGRLIAPRRSTSGKPGHGRQTHLTPGGTAP